MYCTSINPRTGINLFEVVVILLGSYVIVLAGEYQSNNPKRVVKFLSDKRKVLLQGLDTPINVDLLIAVKSNEDEDDCL